MLQYLFFDSSAEIIKLPRMTSMQKFIPRLFAAILLLAASFNPAAGREIKACGHPDYPPWNWVRNGEIVGVCADVTRKAFERLGHTVKLAYVGPWKRCQALVQSGEVDVNICAFKNPEREAYSRFVDVPLGTNPIAIFVRKGHQFPFEKWSDLANKRSGVVNGVSMGTEFDTFLATQTKLETVERPVLNLRKLIYDRLDFLPLGLEAGILQAQLYGFGDNIVPLPKHALEGKLYISITKHATDLHQQIPGIKKYLSRPEYRNEIANLLRQYREQYVRERRNSSDHEFLGR